MYRPQIVFKSEIYILIRCLGRKILSKCISSSNRLITLHILYIKSYTVIGHWKFNCVLVTVYTVLLADCINWVFLFFIKSWTHSGIGNYKMKKKSIKIELFRHFGKLNSILFCFIACLTIPALFDTNSTGTCTNTFTWK